MEIAVSERGLNFKVKPARTPGETATTDPTRPQPEAAQTLIQIQKLTLRYGEKVALRDIDLEIPERRVTAFIGPSGCGKSTLLRCLNRMNDLVDNISIDGKILLDGTDIYDRRTDVVALRQRVGMV